MIIEIRSLDLGYIMDITPTYDDSKDIECSKYFQTFNGVIAYLNDLKDKVEKE